MKFHSSTSGEILMFAETARTLLGVLGKERTERGVITLEQLPEHIERLRTAMAIKSGTANAGPQAGQSEAELPVGFRQRAAPFLELLERTLKREGYVLWEAPGGFSAD